MLMHKFCIVHIVQMWKSQLKDNTKFDN